MKSYRKIFEDSMAIKQQLAIDPEFQGTLEEVIDAIEQTFRAGGKVLLCGNGGSAADAQHIAAELSGRFYLDRKPLYAEALHVNTSFLTAVANDYGFEEAYSRMVEACGKKGDVLIGISTSGNSKNVVNAMKKARELEMKTIAFLGKNKGEVGSDADFSLHVPSNDTPRIQEVHILIGHIICESIEKRLFA